MNEIIAMPVLDSLVLWVHLVAAAAWVGGIIFLGLVMQPVAKNLISDPIERSKFLGKVGSRFNSVGWGSLGVLALTGLYNLVRVAGGVSNVPLLLLRTHFGLILDVKLILVLGMVLITAHHTFISSPKVRNLVLQLEATQNEKGSVSELERRIRRLHMQNGILMGILTLFALATLLFATLLVLPF
jgi:uncharacterized membrane protein